MKTFSVRWFITVLLILSFATGCSGKGISSLPEPTPVPSPAYWPVGGWKPSTPEQQGMDSEVLANMLEAVAQKGTRMHSIVIIRDGYMVLEAYFNPYTAETHHQIASITKSVMGALVGIAIEQGKIKSYQEPVVNFFSDREIANLDARKKAMTLEHLLMLAPGLDCSDVQGTEAEMMASENWVQYVLDLPMKSDPGKQWAYCSSAVHLISAILQKATGMDARTYANQFLFLPIGIKEVPLDRWYTDPQGISGGGNGLMLTPAEVARFAYLYMNQGRWGDKQVVPARWVAASLTPHIQVGKMKEYGDMDRSYGYLWSLYPEQKLISALGRNGQHIHMVPEENLVVVFTSATPVASDEKQFDLLKDYILPAVKSKTALPENAAGASRLADLVEQAVWPRQQVASLSPTAQSINGRAIHIDNSPFGWDSLTMHFAEGENSAVVEFNDGLMLQVGMDNLYRVQSLDGVGKVGFKGKWDGPDTLIINQIFVGTWTEFEIKVQVDGSAVTLFQRNIVDGGNLIRAEGAFK